jgi:hypothetical protein
MIDVKQAVKAATQFAEDVLGPENVQGARLEEVEISEDGGHWLITLGFLGPEAPAGRRTAFEALAGIPGKRDYKVFKIDRETGTVISMKIRSVSPE